MYYSQGKSLASGATCMVFNTIEEGILPQPSCTIIRFQREYFISDIFCATFDLIDTIFTYKTYIDF